MPSTNINNIFDNTPVIMGILNITPNSFYKKSRIFNLNDLKIHINSIIESDIIDIGAESTQPYSSPVNLEDELNRFDLIFNNMNLFKNKILSVDTYKPEVAKKALENGFQIINDIYGGKNEKILMLAAEFNVKIILMHIKGKPSMMQKNTHYDDIIDDIIAYFEERIAKSIKFGIKESDIIIDPGIGFGKSLSDNYKIINNIKRFKSLGFQVMIGLSRKSFLSINNDIASDRFAATIGANTIAILNGADILRVHDVDEHVKLRGIINNFIKNK